jgi:hypothetical protein
LVIATYVFLIVVPVVYFSITNQEKGGNFENPSALRTSVTVGLVTVGCFSLVLVALLVVLPLALMFLANLLHPS